MVIIFVEHLSNIMRKMGFRPSAPDADFWIKKVGDHYEYVATYVDDLLVLSKDPMKLIAEIQKDYMLKGIGIPEYFTWEEMLFSWMTSGSRKASQLLLVQRLTSRM